MLIPVVLLGTGYWLSADDKKPPTTTPTIPKKDFKGADVDNALAWFLVAFANRADIHHAWAVELAERVSEPLLTCEAVLAEAAGSSRGWPPPSGGIP